MWSRMPMFKLQMSIHKHQVYPPETSSHTLYFKNEMEQSLLIGEEVELKNDSESSDTDTDSDTDTVSSNNSDSADDM